MASNNTLQKFDGIIIEPEMDARMRLKQVCASVVNFGKVLPLGSFAECLSKLSGDTPADVVFVSARLGQNNISAFIRDAKATTNGQDSAYILVIPSKDSNGAIVAQSVMMGADGLIFEPYSVDQLVEITNLSARVRKERSTAREEAALKFLITDIIHQIDLIAYSKTCGYEIGTPMRAFKQACTVLGTLEAESIQNYYRIVTDLFEAAPVAANLYQRKKYGGASSRVKRKMAEKLAGEVEKVAPTTPAPGPKDS